MNVKTIIATIVSLVLTTQLAIATTPYNQTTTTKPATQSYNWQTLSKTAVIKDHREDVIRLKAITDQCFASVSYDCTIKFWDSKTKQRVAVLKEAESIVLALTALSPTVIANGTNNGVVNIKDIKTGHWIFSADWLSNGYRREPIWALEAMDAETLAVSSFNAFSSPCYVVNIWHTPTMRLQKAMAAHEDKCTALQKVGTNLLASGSHDHTIKIWDTSAGKLLRTLTGHRKRVTSLALLCQGILVSASDDCTIKIWDVASGICLKTLSGHADAIDAIATTPGNIIASTSHDTIKIWDAVSGNCLKTIRHDEGMLLGLTFIYPENGRIQLACGSERGTITIFECATH
jgi:WD40 repeat protein